VDNVIVIHPDGYLYPFDAPHPPNQGFAEEREVSSPATKLTASGQAAVDVLGSVGVS
jgi:hypothetical protein